MQVQAYSGPLGHLSTYFEDQSKKLHKQGLLHGDVFYC